MPDQAIAFIIPLVAIAIIFAWVPLLNLVCPPCGRAVERRRLQMSALEARSSMESIRD